MPSRADDPPAHPRGLDDSALLHLLGYRLARANAATREVFFRHLGTELGLRPVEFSILLLLWRNPGATPKRIAQALVISAPSLTVLLDRMSTKGWIERQRSEVDRRAQNIHLTASGAELTERAYQRSLTMEQDLLRPFSEGERAMLVELLAKLARQRRA